MFEREKLIGQLGSHYTNRVVDRFRRFSYISNSLLEILIEKSLTEHWGANSAALHYYLATYVPWSIEQGCYTYDSNRFYVTAGHLQTRYGTPIYLSFERNRQQEEYNIPWALNRVDTEIYYAPQPPTAPDIPSPPEIPAGVEIVMAHEHILGENAERVAFLKDTPPIAQICAVAGAIQWSLNRELALPYWYYGKMNFIVPLYLRSREDITQAPDAVAPIEVRPQHLFVRTVLKNYMPYANARVGVVRHDQLPKWLLTAWDQHAASISEAEIENPEEIEISQDEESNSGSSVSLQPVISPLTNSTQA